MHLLVAATDKPTRSTISAVSDHNGSAYHPPPHPLPRSATDAANTAVAHTLGERCRLVVCREPVDSRVRVERCSGHSLTARVRRVNNLVQFHLPYAPPRQVSYILLPVIFDDIRTYIGIM